MKRRSSWLEWAPIIALCFMGLLLVDCGKKGRPRPPEKEKLPRVKDLQAVVLAAGVELTWTLKKGEGNVVGFNVYRSKPQPEISDCPGCTRDFELITAIKVKPGQTRFQVIDPYIGARGVFYYRVTPFDEQDQPGPESNETRVLVE